MAEWIDSITDYVEPIYDRLCESNLAFECAPLEGIATAVYFLGDRLVDTYIIHQIIGDIMMEILHMFDPIGTAIRLMIQSVCAFILIVLIRITTPRLKLESLSRIGGVLGFSAVGFVLSLYLCVGGLW